MPTNAQKARAGGHLVVAELLRRGVGDVTFDDRRRSLEIVATDGDGARTVTLRVKTKTTGDWQTTVELGDAREPNEAEDQFWVLVDIGRESGRPVSFFVVPDWWMRNYIHEEYQGHLRRHGGTRPVTPTRCTAQSGPLMSRTGATAGTRSACAD